MKPGRGCSLRALAVFTAHFAVLASGCEDGASPSEKGGGAGGAGGGGAGGATVGSGVGGQGGDGAGGAGGGSWSPIFPRDEADDAAPYSLPADCAALPSWTLPSSALSRVHALGPTEAWVITEGAGLPNSNARLVHLRPDGGVVEEEWTGLNDVWGCEVDGQLETWAVGNGGLALRKHGAGSWTEVDLGTSANILGGAGCGDEVWLAADVEVLVLRPDGITRIDMPIDPNNVVYEAARVHATGPHRLVTSYYGSTLWWDSAKQDFVLISGTDDIVTDAFVRRNGAGMSLHGGYAIFIDAVEPGGHEFVPDLVAVRADRRGDDDVVFVGGDAIVFDDGVDRTASPSLHSGLEDVDARADSIWVVGFEGVQILTSAGWCAVGSAEE